MIRFQIEKMHFLARKYVPYIIIAALAAIILASLFVHIKIYTMNRSFHLDEAMFAESIITRNFTNLAAEPLLNDQTAPILYLYTVKLLSVLFGPTETALRIFSLITFGGVLVITGILLRNVFKVNSILILLGICILSTLSIYMRYSNELKPYMSDSFFVLFVLLLYFLYTIEKLKLPVLVCLYCIAILFSSPALFFAAAVFIFEFIDALTKKNYKNAGKITMAGIIVLICFIVYYILWLMPVAESEYMIDFWKTHRFYLFTTKKENIINNILNIARIFRRFGTLFFVYPLLFSAGLCISLRQRNRMSFIGGLALFLLLVASHLGKYPMEPRLYMFIYAIIVLYSIICVNFVFINFSGKKIILGIAVFLSAILVLNNADFTKYAEDRVYIETHEVNPLIEYVQKNIRDGEYLYASSASYVLRFRNGYNTNKIGAVSHDNILYGGDISHIVDARKVFLIFQRRPSASFLKELETKGYLHEVGSCYQTPLYYFSTDGDDPRLQEVFESRDFNDDITIIFRFTIKRIINIWVKNDDDTDKIYIHADTYKRGVVVPHEFSVRRP